MDKTAPLELQTYRFGAPGAAPPLLIAHGLFGSARNWNAVAKSLSTDREVLSVDMRNHGQSPWAETHGYEDLAADLARSIGQGPWDVLGHSMGGKAAMALALLYPGKVRRLLVADIAPVAYTHTQSHLIHALRKVEPDAMTSRSQADRALAPHIEDRGIRAFLLQSLDRTEGRWRLNLDVLEAEMAKIIGWPALSGAFPGPSFFLAGGASDYVNRAHRPTIKALFPAARHAKIPGAGHWLHADAPAAFIANARAMLAAD